MKSIKLHAQNRSVILRGLAAGLIVSSAWSLIFLSIGFSRSKSEAENFMASNRQKIETALTEGDLLHLHSILRGLEKFGIESSHLQTDIFVGNQKRRIVSGRLGDSILSDVASIELMNNGLTLGTLTYRTNFLNVFQKLLQTEWHLLTIILMSHLLTFLTLNYVFMLKIRQLQEELITAVKEGKTVASSKKSYLSKMLFTEYFDSALSQIARDISLSRELEVRHLVLEAEKAITRQVAHDIRSPLSAINLILNKLSGPEEAKELLRFSLKRIHAIADDLLKKVRNSNPNGIIPVCNEVSVDKLIYGLKKLVEEQRVQHPSAYIAFEALSYEADSKLQIDLDALMRIGTILINNSIESFSTDHERISIFLTTENNNLTIIFSDTGPGIPHNVIQNLGLTNNTYGKKQGNGIGLSYVYKTVNAMSGHLKIDSNIGIGTSIKISFHNLKAVKGTIDLKNESI